MYSTALENTAPAMLLRTIRSNSLLEGDRQPVGARNHSSGLLRSHLALEIAARASYFVCDSTRKHRPRVVDSHKQPLDARKHGSGVFRSHLALEIVVGARFIVSESTFSFPSQCLSKSLCFELCIASSCALRDFTRTVTCHMRI